jgi:Tfp pilus assembly protein PilP
MRRIRLAIAIAISVAACGGGKDEPEGGQQAGQPVPAGAAAQPTGGGSGSAKKDPLQVNVKVEDIVPPDEVATIRHKFKERDFAPDLTGDENRDPFQSFVIVQPGVGTTNSPGTPLPATEQCTSKQQVATNYALRDLRLAAIITRGLKRYALFQDTADLGHVVAKLDCLGKEKARVKEIGERTVTLELVPEQVPNQAPRAPEEKSIPLYPTELPVGAVDNSGDDQNGGNAPQTNVPLPPPPTQGGPMLRNVPVDQGPPTPPPPPQHQ